MILPVRSPTQNASSDGVLTCASPVFSAPRGAVLPFIALAAVPVIGITAMGTEAGVWYVVKRHTQNAADSAAYAGALQLAIDKAATNVVTTGKQFAAQNSFSQQVTLRFIRALPAARCRRVLRRT